MGRRVGVALAWAAVTGLVAVGVAGFLEPFQAQAGRKSGSDVPPEFSLPLPHVGDRGQFVLSESQQPIDDEHVAALERPLAEFEWLSDGRVRDAAGSLRWANRLDYTDYENAVADPNVAGGWRGVSSFVVHFDAASGAILGYESKSSWTGSASQQGISGYSGGSGSGTRYWVLYPSDEPSKLPTVLCGIRTTLQGRRIATSEPTQMGEGCKLFDRLIQPDGPRFIASGVGSVEGYEALRFQEMAPASSSAEAPPVQVWLSSRVPYPLHIEQRAPGAEASRGVIRLATYEAGRSPILQGDFGVDVGTPLAWRPTLPWGPDDAGMPHQFPLSAAYQRMVNDDQHRDVRDWLAGNPDGFTYFATYRETIDPDDDRLVWDVALTDGEDVIRRCPELHRWHPVRFVLRTDTVLDEANYTENVYAQECETSPPNIGAPLPTRPPVSMPTIASLEERWKSHASESFRDLRANFWRFHAFCPQWPCAQVDFSIAIGYVHNEGTYTLSSLSQLHIEDRVAHSILVMDGQGRAITLEESVDRNERALGASSPPSLAGSGENGDAAGGHELVASLKVWKLPVGEYAAGAGLAAVAVGLIYWFWQSAKGFLVFGFTRLDRERVVEHPVRSAILELAQANPGIHVQEIRRRLSLPNGTTIHHLSKLVELGHLSEISTPGYTCYFPVGQANYRVMAATAILKSETARRILAAVRASPGSSITHLAASTATKPQLVGYHLKRMQEWGLVSVQHMGKIASVMPTDVASSAIPLQAD